MAMDLKGIGTKDLKKIDVESKEDVLLAEYEALCTESQRCSQLIAMVLWLGFSGFLVTTGALLVMADKTPSLLPLGACFLCIQSSAASTVLLGELWKLNRVGFYIREMVENRLSRTDPDGGGRLLNWEHWVFNNRARLFYITSLLFLQLPVAASALLLTVFHCCGSSDLSSALDPVLSQFKAHLVWVEVLWGVIFVDFAFVGFLAWKVWKPHWVVIKE